MPDRLVRGLPGVRSVATFCGMSARPTWRCQRREKAYKISQMDVAFVVEQHVVGFDIAVDNVLLVDITKSAAEL